MLSVHSPPWMQPNPVSSSSTLCIALDPISALILKTGLTPSHIGVHQNNHGAFFYIMGATKLKVAFVVSKEIHFVAQGLWKPFCLCSVHGLAAAATHSVNL